MTDQPETRMVAVDGTDALAYVILRPGSNASGVVIEAAAKGISKPYAAYALRHTAQSWDPDDTVGTDVGEQLKEALAEIERMKVKATHLRADLASYQSESARYDRDHEQLSAELKRARAADDAVLAVMTHYRDAPGDASRWAILSDLAIARDGHIPEALATPACSCRAEAVHQAGCDTGLGA